MAESEGIKILNYFLKKFRKFFLSRDVLIFLLFFAFSAIFWFIHALGKERETTYSLPIRYEGLPVNVAFTNNPPYLLKIKLRDKGLHLLNYSNSNLTPLTIDLSRSLLPNNQVHITHEELLDRLNKYFVKQKSTTILEVDPDSIVIPYHKLLAKTIPIKLISKIELKTQFMLSKPITYDPKLITVYGNVKDLEKITSIETEPLIYNNLSEDVNTTLNLRFPPRLQYTINNVKVDIQTEAFTEKKVQIPITSVHCPQSLAIRTFPATVTATYIVGINHFKQYSRNDIEVYVDFNDLEKNTDENKQILKIKNNSPYISNIRIIPKEVEYILEQK